MYLTPCTLLMVDNGASSYPPPNPHTLTKGTYEGVCKLMTPEGGTNADLGPTAHLLGGALAGVTYWTAFYPADTVKSLVCGRGTW